MPALWLRMILRQFCVCVLVSLSLTWDKNNIGLPWWLNGKESTLPMQEMRVQSLGWDSLEEELATNSSILAWKILSTEEHGRQPPRGSSFQCYGLVKALVLNHCLLNNFVSEKCNKIQSSFLVHLRLLDFQKVFWKHNRTHSKRFREKEYPFSE